MLGYTCGNHITIENFYTVFHMKLSSNHRSGNEIYNFWELVYVMDGTLDCTASNNIYRLQKNSLILFRPNEFHTLGVPDGHSAEIFILSFSITGHSVHKLNPVPLVLNQTLYSAMNNIIDFCLQSSSQTMSDNNICGHHLSFMDVPLFLPKMCALTQFLLLSLCDESPVRLSPVDSKDTALFSAITETMICNEDRFFTISQLSEMHHASPSKIKTLIKKYAATSLHEYYIELKLTRAHQLFMQGYGVAETSELLGFCNPNYFSTVFKRKIGVSPSARIRKLKNML